MIFSLKFADIAGIIDTHYIGFLNTDKIPARIYLRFSDMALNTPILFIIFNRPKTTTQVFEKIRTAQPSKLFIAADGPRLGHPADAELCRQARNVALQVDWPCHVATLFHEKNLGCRFGPASAISWFFDNVEEGIILEDDCLPCDSFFQFCSQMLEYFRQDQRIFSINGSNLGYAMGASSYSFTRFMNMWGWATWRRVAVTIDYELAFLRDVRCKKLWFMNRLLNWSSREVDYNWIKYWLARYEWIVDGFETWDYQWLLNQMRYKKLSVVPATNLVKNIGFGSDATHTHDPDFPCAAIETDNMQFPLTHPKRIREDMRYLNEIVKGKWAGYRKEPLVEILQNKSW